MFASSLGPRTRRRGIVLVLILGMLGLVALIGVTFATFAGQSLKGSRDFMQGVARPSGEVLMDYALAQLINDTSNPASAIRGHSLLRDMYGNDSVFRGSNPGISPAGTIKGHLDQIYTASGWQSLQIVGGSITGTYNTTSGTPYYNQIQIETNIPISGAYLGLDFTRWILTLPQYVDLTTTPRTIGGAQTFEILNDAPGPNGTHVFTLSNNLGNPAGTTSGDTSSRIFNNPNLVESGTATRDPVLLNGATGIFTLDAQYMRAFNGPGMTRPDYDTVTAVQAGSPTSVYPNNFAAYGNFRLNGLDPDAVGMDEDYDACDLENWFLAIQSADGQVIVPSFHRPGIIVKDANGNTDWTVAYDLSSTADQDVINRRRASKILRPRQGDHSPLFPADPTPNVNTGKITYDVDNDGDGITDSVWLDLGYPIQRDPGGKLYKPLFAFMVLGLNGRLPLNTAGNLQARAHSNAYYGPAFLKTNDPVGDPYTTAPPPSGNNPSNPFQATGSLVAVPYPGAYVDNGMGTAPFRSTTPLMQAQAFVSQTWTDAPLWDHASHLGYSVNEINPKYALQNAPNNVFPTNNRRSDGLFPIFPVSYSQYDDAGMDVSLTQLRNLLTGTVPTDQPTPLLAASYPITPASVRSNSDTNGVMVGDKSIWIFPNNVYDSFDAVGTGGGVRRSNGAVAGRWGDVEGVPTTIDYTTGSNALYQIYQVSAAQPYMIAPFVSPVRAGRSLAISDILDDDFDSTDPVYVYPGNTTGDATIEAYGTPPQNGLTYPPAGTTNVIRRMPEDVDTFDGISQFRFPSERIRRFRTPIDPSATGRITGFMQRPEDRHDEGMGYDSHGRVGFFRYFRPGGMPQRITYPYTMTSADATITVPVTNFQKPQLSPATAADTSNNTLGGFSQALFPGKLTIDTNGQNVAVMGAMPFDYTYNPPTPPASPSGYQPVMRAPSMYTTLAGTDPNTTPTAPVQPQITKVGTDWGPNFGGAAPPAYMVPGAVAAQYLPFGSLYGPYATTGNMGVVNGYLGGSLNKDEADEMNLYIPTQYDQPFGPSDLEWLYRAHDVDGASLTSRLSKLAPISFTNPADGLTRRRLFSVDSWEPISFVYANDNPAGYAHEQTVIYDGLRQPPFQFNSRFSPRASASLYAMNQVAMVTPPVPATLRYPGNFLNYTHANPISTEFIPNPTLPMNPNPNNNTATAGTSINAYIPNNGVAAPTPLPFALDNTASSLFNNEVVTATPLNYSALQTASVPVQTPALAHRDRRINLNYPLPISNDPAEPIRQKWIRETYQLLKAVLPPQSVDTPQELAALSQFVVNIIDFRDPDCTATRFINTDLESVAATDTAPANVQFATSGLNPNYPYDPTLYVLNPTTANPQTRFLIQHGMEASPIAINEVMAYSSIYSDGGTTKNNNRLYIELVNTLTQDQPTTGTGPDASDINLTGWDVVVTPDVYGWGRPDPITGEVSTAKFPAVTKSTTPNANVAPQPKTAPGATTPPPTTGLDRVNNGIGLPGYIIGSSDPAATRATLESGSFTTDPYVRAINPANSNPRYFILANEAATSATIGSGNGGAPTGAEVNGAAIPNPRPANATYGPIDRINPPAGSENGNPTVDGLFPDYVVPFGSTLTILPPASPAATPTYATTGPTLTSGEGHYFWVFLRRPANPFDTTKLTDANPNREMVVVDSMRFRFVQTGTVASHNNDVSSTQRFQPHRGGHRVPTNTKPGADNAATTPISPPSVRHAWGYSEQTAPPPNNFTAETDNKAKFGSDDVSTNLEHTLGRKNRFASLAATPTVQDGDDSWAHLPFHDRDFSSVAELLLVPGCPPGLFTKQFVEEGYPGNYKSLGYDDLDPSMTTSAIKMPNRDTSPGTVEIQNPRVGRRNFNVDTSATGIEKLAAVPTFPYLSDNFYYSAASIAPPLAQTYPAMATPMFPNEVGGRTGAGWFKMFEFLEVPSSANGATGAAADGVDFDWYRADVKPGLMNLNLLIDEEAFFGIIDDDRLNRRLAAGFYPVNTDVSNYLPSIVTQVDANGYPSVLQTGSTTVAPTLARYPISDLDTQNSGTGSYGLLGGKVGRGFVYRDPTLSASLVHGMKASFSDFLKLRHGGSGYLFAHGSGMPGSGIYLPTSTAFASLSSLVTTPVASERPFRSLSFPDINYTIMRPASLPPSTYTDLAGTQLPSSSFPKIPQAGDGGIVTGLAPPNNDGTPSHLSYVATAAVDVASQNVTMVPAEAPNNFTPAATNPAYQYVFDPGMKNPYLARQFNPAALLPPQRALQPAVPPTPTRRLFEIPDKEGLVRLTSPPSPTDPNVTQYSIAVLSYSNASLHGEYHSANVNVTTDTQPLYLVNQNTSGSQLTTGDTRNLTNPLTNATNLGISPPSLVWYNDQAVLMPDNQTQDGRLRSSLLGGNSTKTDTVPNPNVDYYDNRQHPLYRTEWLQKIMNLTTVRTHQYAVWITVGFFEVVKQGIPEFGVIDQLGGELNAAAGSSVRYRSFFVLDRTKAKGFNPYYPGDFRDVVTYRRRIE